MDQPYFDALTRALSAPGSRRRLLALLATLPILGGLPGLVTPEDAEAKERRRRRKQRHKRRKSAGGRKGKGCKPRSQARVCAGKCGPVKSRKTCGKTVDCGSCDCNPACAVCFTCQGAAGAPGTCTPVEDGTSCAGGNVCCGGTCQECCDTTQCSTLEPICDAGTCTICSPEHPCPAGQCCAGDGTCGSCLVFVTSSKHDGDLGGLLAADAICQARAGDASLPGTYKAWLSDDSGSPGTRFAQATVPYTLTNGTSIADGWAELTSGTLAAPINVTETGAVAPLAAVWTNTKADGTSLGGADCGSWLIGTSTADGSFGALDRTDSGWTDLEQGACGPPPVAVHPLHLYCFQQE